MGKALADAFAPARRVFEEVDAALGERLSDTIWNGPAETLTLTENAQPALMAVSLAVLRVLEDRGRRRSRARCGLRCRPFARRIFGARRGARRSPSPTRPGFCASAAAPCRRRCRSGVGAMAALIGVEFGEAKAIAAEAAGAGVCSAANDNGGGQVVLSGEKSAVERAVEIAKAHGVKRAMMLPVSAPFHCSLMQPAADAMAEALATVAVKPPRVPLVANVLAQPISEPADDRALPGRAGDRHGSLARIGPVHGAGGRRRRSTRSAPARCSPA